MSELCNELLDDIDFHFNKVKCRKIEGMMPRLMKMVKVEMKKYEINSMGESVSTVTAGMVAMVSQHTMIRVNES